MKTKFACSHCNKRHEEKESIVLKEDGGVLVYGVNCMREMAAEIDALSKDEAAAELLECTDKLREIFLARRAEGMKTYARIRRRTEDVNLALVKGDRG